MIRKIGRSTVKTNENHIVNIIYLTTKTDSETAKPTLLCQDMHKKKATDNMQQKDFRT